MDEAGEEARRKMEEMRLEGKELKDDAGQMGHEKTESAAGKAREVKDSTAERYKKN